MESMSFDCVMGTPCSSLIKVRAILTYSTNSVCSGDVCREEKWRDVVDQVIGVTNLLKNCCFCFNVVGGLAVKVIIPCADATTAYLPKVKQLLFPPLRSAFAA